MRFALINDERVESSPRQKGSCPGCVAPVTAKCGTQRIWHWAHDNKKCCDNWWKPETEWHRAWKDKFPRECQESHHHDELSGERHIADVKTKSGLVIEFQHSHLNPEERIARESFYKNMVWVVDGMRLKRDYLRFLKGQVDFRSIPGNRFFYCLFPEEYFPVGWLESSVPVIFDFQSVPLDDPQNTRVKGLWCLLPGRMGSRAVVFEISSQEFIARACSPNEFQDMHKIIPLLRGFEKERSKLENALRPRITYRPGRWARPRL